MKPPVSSYAVVLLAGGASSRMGRPKALLPVGEETFADRLIRVFLSAGVEPVLVLGFGSDEIRAGLQRAEAAFVVVNPDPSRGQLSSLQTGLRAIPGGMRGIFFHPVDVPAVSERTVRMLMEAMESSVEEKVLFVPSHQGRRGHPVLMRAALSAEFLKLAPAASAREVIHARRAGTRYVETGDAGILRDIDTPAEYAEWSAETAP